MKGLSIMLIVPRPQKGHSSHSRSSSCVTGDFELWFFDLFEADACGGIFESLAALSASLACAFFSTRAYSLHRARSALGSGARVMAKRSSTRDRVALDIMGSACSKRHEL